VFADSRGRTWFATDRVGVDCLIEGRLLHYPELESEVVYGFSEGADGSIWANVQGEGFYRLQPEGTEFVHMGTDTLLLELDVPVLARTPEGELVAAHRQGLAVFRADGSLKRTLGDEVGWQGRKPNLNTAALTPDGLVVVGTDLGIVRYRPEEVQFESSPRAHIESIRVPDRLVAATSAAAFNFNENDLTVRYLAFWYQSPDDVLFRYRLEGHDRDWIISRDRSVVYSSLGPGTYTFRVQASLTEDFSRSSEDTMVVTIHPPFWKQGWFIGLSVFAFAFAVAAVVKIRERNLRHAKRELELKVIERTREIQQMNEAIQRQTEQIKAINENLEELVRQRTSELETKNKTLEDYAFMNAHNLRSPVASILGLINLMDRLELEADQRVYLDHLKSSAESLDKVVRSITRRIEQGQGL
jgi:hypothetical protein